MQKMQDDYNRMLQEWYSLTGSSAYQEQQDYYAGNYESMYGGGGGSQDNPYPAAPADDPAAAAASAAATSFTAGGPSAASGLDATTDIRKLMGQSFPITQPRTDPFPAAAGQAYRASAAPASNDRGGDRIVAKAPAPALVPAVSRANPPAPTPTLNSFIQRYDRDESSPVVAPAKIVAPVKTVVKKSVTPVKVWGNRNN